MTRVPAVPPCAAAALFASAEARRLFWLCGALLLLSALALNLKVVGFDFLYLRDDDVNVTLNPHMGGITPARLKWMFTDWSYVRRYMPLGWLNLSATYQFAGLDPAPYHAVALGFYVLNCGLVFALIVQALRLFAPGRERGLGPWDVGAAALASGWWAFHPFRVETTAWISGNLYGQSMALLLVSLLAYLRTYPNTGRRRAAWLGLSVAAFAASLFTYPLALGVPVLLVGLDWLQTRGPAHRPWRRLLWEKAAFFVPVAAVLAVTLFARFGTTEVFGEVPDLAALPLASRIAQSAYVAAYYLWKPWWPFHLAPIYDTLVEFRAADARFVLSIAAVAAASLWALLSFRRRPIVTVLWFGYLALAAPFFGVTEKPHMASDRYGYFLTVMMAAVLAAALARVSSRTARLAAALVSLALIGVLGRLTWRQFDVWTSDRAQHAYLVAHLRNAGLLDEITSRQVILEFLRGNEAASEREVRRQLAANPNSLGFRLAGRIILEKQRISAYYGPVTYISVLQQQLALGFAKAGELREADDHFQYALRPNDHFYQAAFDRASVLLQLGRLDDALRSFLLADRWAAPALPRAQKRSFLDRLEVAAEAQGRGGLAAAVRRALAR